MTIPSFSDLVAASRQDVDDIDLRSLSEAGIYRTPLQYYLVGTYPPLKALAPIEPDEVFSAASSRQNIYVHIPFCEQYCTFCHFFKEIEPQSSRVERYVAALCADLEVTSAALSFRPQAETVYFGGGTPSYLNPPQIERVFTALWNSVDRVDSAEVTFELHPGVVRQPDYGDRLDTLAAAGVNRWVFGIQSMDEGVLKKLNRGHGRGDVFRLLEMLAERDLANLSVDLMFGLPYQTLENWYSTMTTLLDAGITKFNIFPLMFKRSDPITKQYIREPEIFPSAEARLTMHFMVERLLGSQGFNRGPLFYYAKSDHHSHQQENKFDAIEDVNLLPFGVSGFGYVGGTQYYNHCTLDDYFFAVGKGSAPVWRGWTLDEEERARRAIMFGLRSRGVDVPGLSALHRIDVASRFARELQLLDELGLTRISADGIIEVTDLGALMADGAATLFASPSVLERVTATNDRITHPARDPVDRYDYSPIARVDAPGGIEVG